MEDSYLRKQEEQFREYEGRCLRCGECCGVNGTDPCANLIKQSDGKYYCSVYENRLGPQKTVSGNVFNCVTIRDVVRFGVSYRSCPYTPD
ncbi:MAG: hypothetical protein Q8R48_06510 [Candidatus Omnitrophota bacterium]|nr:hypothetical protein [Candidatus Omnitrophota bacterium]